MAKMNDTTRLGVDGPRKLDRIRITDTSDRRWEELTVALARDWPDRPEPLDHSAVIGRLRQLGAQATRRLPAVRLEVIDDAPGVVFQAFARCDRGRRFDPWARTVLHNHAVSLYQQQSRMRPDSDYLSRVESRVVSCAHDELAAVLRDFRRLCDVVSFPRRTPKSADVTVVFALETRLRLLHRLGHQDPDFVDRHLPLRDWERPLLVQHNWPTLGALWSYLAHAPEPGLRNIEAIRRACRRLAPLAAVDKLHKVWNTWLHRAKQAVMQQLESHAHARLFSVLFPRHAPVEARSSPGGLACCREAS
jgi:hypothetical protein